MLTEQAAIHALAMMAALAKRAGGTLRVELAELNDDYEDVAITMDGTGITAELIERAAPGEAAAAVDALAQIDRRIETLQIGAAIARGGMKYRD